jgi:hypothetical protein
MSLKDLIKEVHSPGKLVPTLSQFLRERAINKEPREDGWHPSQFAGMCPRLSVLDKLLGPAKAKSIDVKTERIWDVGTALHAWYQNEYLSKMGILWGRWECSHCHYFQFGFTPKTCSNPACSDSSRHFIYREVPVLSPLEGCELPAVGHSDGLILIENRWYVLEIKTINSFGFGSLDEPYESHKLQAQIYAELIVQSKIRNYKSDVPSPIPVGIIFLYIQKNDSAEKEFFLELDSRAARLELQKPRIVEEAIRNHTLPDRKEECISMLKEPAKKCSRCSHCFGQKSFDELALFKN